MDETYIKMCDCEEIQAKRDLARDGDCFYMEDHRNNEINPEIFFNCHDEFECYCNVSLAESKTHVADKFIWLPLQHQLQEMVKSECPLELLNRFYRWINDTDIAEFDDSMEQLWLAFVMSEVHGKVWVNDKWVKQNG